ncbi:HtrA protease/chaperone protein [Litoreibacter arenae DSM 19593]|uniref:Probable periplasmic serine endoprotease DegP-like n=1 Tax=Litoreibacter arenae DSM 19593 TaxID=1123360 RepID=S9RPQ3_9RHOB|nr:HtrA protease/chaperone protein [Litoreibacter arenae DSM 19593]
MKANILTQTNRQTGLTRGVSALMLGLALVFAQAISANAKMPESFADLADQVSPAVVNITTSTTVAGMDQGPRPIVPEGSPLEDFFKDFLDRQQDGQRSRRSSALGSGFVISEDGYIVTNNHVIDKADEIEVEFFSGEKLDAELIGTDPKTDIALLKVESDKPLPFVSFGDSDAARVGDWVVAVGNPLGQGFSVSAGIVSQRGRALSGTYDDFIQTDAAINRGNSGGPLFNVDAEVIGVNTAILSPSGGSIGIGFSMASNVVTKVVDQLKEFGETRRGWLGVRIQDVTEDVAEALELASAKGALVTDVPEGPGKEAGIKAGDVITTFDGAEVEDTRELVRLVGNTTVGKAVRVVVIRDGKSETLKVTLGRREEAEATAVPVAMDKADAEESTVLGMTVAVLNDELREQLALDEGVEGLVVKEVAEDSDAFEKGLRAGDLIVEAGQQKITSVDDLEARIEEAREGGRKSFLMLIRREGDPRFVALSLEE